MQKNSEHRAWIFYHFGPIHPFLLIIGVSRLSKSEHIFPVSLKESGPGRYPSHRAGALGIDGIRPLRLMPSNNKRKVSKMSTNNEKIRMQRLPIYRVALVKESSQSSMIDRINTPRNVF
jgi:hypothetical protein